MKTPPLPRPTAWQTLIRLPDLRRFPRSSAEHHGAADHATAPARPRRKPPKSETTQPKIPATAASAQPLLRIDQPAEPRPPASSLGHPEPTRPRRENSPVINRHPPHPAGGDGYSTARDAFLIDHARDLIDRLADWSLRLDRREQELDARESNLERRARTLRQLQWLAAAVSQQENSATKT